MENLKRRKRRRICVSWGSEGGSYNPPTLYLLPCVETQTQSRTLAESFNTIYSLPRQGKGDQEACHVDGLGLGISRKRGSSHYLRTLYANQGSPSTITANGVGRKKKFEAEALRQLRVPPMEQPALLVMELSSSETCFAN